MLIPLNVLSLILQVLDDLAPKTRLEPLLRLSMICDHWSIVPYSLIIPFYDDPTEAPARSGGSADIWRSGYHSREVAVKVLKVRPTTGSDRTKRVGCLHRFCLMTWADPALQMFCREVVMWKALHHPNILPLLGVTMTDTRFVMVSEWMTNGTINEFVKLHPNADRFELVCHPCNGPIFTFR